MSDMKRFYIDDGVYLQTDGQEVILTSENGISVQNIIYMDAGMIHKVLEKIKEAKKE